MQFGFMFFARDLGEVREAARAGEALGYALLGLGDSPALAFDPYVGLALAAQATGRLRLGPTVTNPQTRHPLIVANLAATLERLAPRRSFLGLSPGNSGVRHAGARPASLAALRETVGVLRALLAGRDVSHQGATLRVMGGGPGVPILIAASGPRSLRLAGEIADVVFVNVGFTPDLVREAMGWVREGARAAGRDWGTIETWVFGIGAIADEAAQALDEARGAAVAVAAYVLPAYRAAGLLPAEVAGRVDQLLAEYQYGEHLTPGRTRNYHLAERLGIAPYLLERFALAGDPPACLARVRALQAIGVDRLCLSYTAGPDLLRYVRLFGEQILPQVGPA